MTRKTTIRPARKTEPRKIDVYVHAHLRDYDGEVGDAVTNPDEYAALAEEGDVCYVVLVSSYKDGMPTAVFEEAYEVLKDATDRAFELAPLLNADAFINVPIRGK